LGTAFTVLIVESEESGRRSSERLMRSHGFMCRTFADADEMLSASELSERTCVIVDDAVTSEAMLLPRALSARGTPFPVILLTDSDSEGLRARARKAGIAACFLKPVDGQALVDAVDWALSATLVTHVLAARGQEGER
jgi:FixJ family two-component response regulator